MGSLPFALAAAAAGCCDSPEGKPSSEGRMGPCCCKRRRRSWWVRLRRSRSGREEGEAGGEGEGEGEGDHEPLVAAGRGFAGIVERLG